MYRYRVTGPDNYDEKGALETAEKYVCRLLATKVFPIHSPCLHNADFFDAIT